MRTLAAMTAAVAVLVPVAVASGQHGDDHGSGTGADHATRVLIRHADLSPRHVAVLPGETVGWVNAATRVHTVTASDGSFDSDRIGSGRRFAHTFPAEGTFAYYCRIHPHVNGSVTVARVLLRGPAQAVRGEAVVLEGRAAAGMQTVTLLRDAGSGPQPVATAQAGEHGEFSVRTTADVTATFRAQAGEAVSAAVPVVVHPGRTIDVRPAHGHHDSSVRVRVHPAVPDGRVLIQRWVKHRFGWWTVARARLRGTGAAATLHAVRPGRVRVVVTDSDGETPRARRLVTLPRR